MFKFWQRKYGTENRPQVELTSIFTAPHGMQTRSSDENSVCLSVCSSNACIVTKRKKALSRFFIPYQRSYSLVFWEEWLVGATPSTSNFGSTGPPWTEIANFEPIVAHSASAVTPSEKVQLTLIGSPAFSTELKMIIVRCP